jgi:hypothetical protein
MNEFEAAYRKIKDQERRDRHEEIRNSAIEARENARSRFNEDRARWSKGHRLLLKVLRMLTEGKSRDEQAVKISRLEQAILEQNPAFPKENYEYTGFRNMLEDMAARGFIDIGDDETCQLAHLSLEGYVTPFGGHNKRRS